MSSIDEFVLRGGQTVTAGQMNDFRRQLPFAKIKAESIDPTYVPHLPEQILFLVRYAEDVLDGIYGSTDLSAVTEAIFGLGYLLKDVDIIPDDVPIKGLADDSAVIRAVLKGHEEEFFTFAEQAGMNFTEISLEP